MTYQEPPLWRHDIVDPDWRVFADQIQALADKYRVHLVALVDENGVILQHRILMVEIEAGGPDGKVGTTMTFPDGTSPNDTPGASRIYEILSGNIKRAHEYRRLN